MILFYLHNYFFNFIHKIEEINHKNFFLLNLFHSMETFDIKLYTFIWNNIDILNKNSTNQFIAISPTKEIAINQLLNKYESMLNSIDPDILDCLNNKNIIFHDGSKLITKSELNILLNGIEPKIIKIQDFAFIKDENLINQVNFFVEKKKYFQFQQKLNFIKKNCNPNLHDEILKLKNQLEQKTQQLDSEIDIKQKELEQQYLNFNLFSYF